MAEREKLSHGATWQYILSADCPRVLVDVVNMKQRQTTLVIMTMGLLMRIWNSKSENKTKWVNVDIHGSMYVCEIMCMSFIRIMRVFVALVGSQAGYFDEHA